MVAIIICVTNEYKHISPYVRTQIFTSTGRELFPRSSYRILGRWCRFCPFVIIIIFFFVRIIVVVVVDIVIVGGWAQGFTKLFTTTDTWMIAGVVVVVVVVVTGRATTVIVVIVIIILDRYRPTRECTANVRLRIPKENSQKRMVVYR